MKKRPYLMALFFIASLVFIPSCDGDRDIDCEYFEDCETTPPSTNKSQVVITYTSAFGPHNVGVYMNSNYIGAAPLQTPGNPATCTTGSMVLPLTEGQSYTIYGYSAVYNIYSSTFTFTAQSNTCHQVNLNL